MIKQLFLEVEEPGRYGFDEDKKHRHLINPRAIDRIEECFTIAGQPRTYIVMNTGDKLLIEEPFEDIVNRLEQINMLEEVNNA